MSPLRFKTFAAARSGGFSEDHNVAGTSLSPETGELRAEPERQAERPLRVRRRRWVAPPSG